MQADALADQLRQDRRDARAARQLGEERKMLVRRLDAPHPRLLRRMGVLEVVDVGMRRYLGGVRHDRVDPALGLGEQLAPEHVRHHQIAQLPVLFDLGRGEHGEGSEVG